MKYGIGDIVRDEDGNFGHVVINYDDGLEINENTAAYPNPVIIGHWPDSISPNKSLHLTAKKRGK